MPSPFTCVFNCLFHDFLTFLTVRKNRNINFSQTNSSDPPFSCAPNPADQHRTPVWFVNVWSNISLQPGRQAALTPFSSTKLIGFARANVAMLLANLWLLSFFLG